MMTLASDPDHIATTSFSATHENPQFTTARGRLWLKVVEARHLIVPNIKRARLYCVVEFEKNEFVTREAIFGSENKLVGIIPTETNQGYPLANPSWRHEAMLYVSFYALFGFIIERHFKRS
jgi:predicted AlkP superfamily pyrophosphatase or phosphodiesterase